MTRLGAPPASMLMDDAQGIGAAVLAVLWIRPKGHSAGPRGTISIFLGLRTEPPPPFTLTTDLFPKMEHDDEDSDQLPPELMVFPPLGCQCRKLPLDELSTSSLGRRQSSG